MLIFIPESSTFHSLLLQNIILQSFVIIKVFFIQCQTACFFSYSGSNSSTLSLRNNIVKLLMCCYSIISVRNGIARDNLARTIWDQIKDESFNSPDKTRSLQHNNKIKIKNTSHETTWQDLDTNKMFTFLEFRRHFYLNQLMHIIICNELRFKGLAQGPNSGKLSWVGIE